MSQDQDGLDAVTCRRMEKAIRYVEDNAQAQPTLEDVAHHVGMSPKRFLQFVTAVHARRLLDERGSVPEAAWGAGLSGPGRLHDLMVNIHAMTPAEVRQGGQGVELRWRVHETPVGPCVLAATTRGVSVLEFLDSGSGDEAKELVAARWPGARRREDAASRVVGRGPLHRRNFSGIQATKGTGPIPMSTRRRTQMLLGVWLVAALVQGS